MWKIAEYIWMEFVHWVKFWFFWLSSVHASSRIKEKLHQFRLEPIKFMITSNGNTRTNRANEKVIYFETRWSTIDFNVSIVSCLILMIYQKCHWCHEKKRENQKEWTWSDGYIIWLYSSIITWKVSKSIFLVILKYGSIIMIGTMHEFWKVFTLKVASNFSNVVYVHVISAYISPNRRLRR